MERRAIGRNDTLRAWDRERLPDTPRQPDTLQERGREGERELDGGGNIEVWRHAVASKRLERQPGWGGGERPRGRRHVGRRGTGGSGRAQDWPSRSASVVDGSVAGKA